MVNMSAFKPRPSSAGAIQPPKLNPKVLESDFLVNSPKPEATSELQLETTTPIAKDLGDKATNVEVETQIVTEAPAPKAAEIPKAAQVPLVDVTEREKTKVEGVLKRRRRKQVITVPRYRFQLMFPVDLTDWLEEEALNRGMKSANPIVIQIVRDAFEKSRKR